MQSHCWSLRCSWSIACRRCSISISILDLTSGFNGPGKDNGKTRRETSKFGDLVRFILEVWWYYTYFVMAWQCGLFGANPPLEPVLTPPPPPSPPPTPHPPPPPPPTPHPLTPPPPPPTPPKQNGRHFANDFFRWIFVNEKFCILIEFSWKVVSKGHIDSNPALVWTMAWCRIGTKPLSEPMLTLFTDAHMRQ